MTGIEMLKDMEKKLDKYLTELN